MYHSSAFSTPHPNPALNDDGKAAGAGVPQSQSGDEEVEYAEYPDSPPPSPKVKKEEPADCLVLAEDADDECWIADIVTCDVTFQFCSIRFPFH